MMQWSVFCELSATKNIVQSTCHLLERVYQYICFKLPLWMFHAY
eukprot:12975.XXX_379258_379389_1 [CDS] Oithona nana genome sequencing.